MRDAKLDEPELWADLRQWFSEVPGRDSEKDMLLSSLARKCMLQILAILTPTISAVPFLPIPFQTKYIEPVILMKILYPASMILSRRF
jgi:hypothetical protein